MKKRFAPPPFHLIVAPLLHTICITFVLFNAWFCVWLSGVYRVGMKNSEKHVFRVMQSIRYIIRLWSPLLQFWSHIWCDRTDYVKETTHIALSRKPFSDFDALRSYWCFTPTWAKIYVSQSQCISNIVKALLWNLCLLLSRVLYELRLRN